MIIVQSLQHEIVTIEELQRKRSYREFVEWIETAQYRFSETDRSRAIARLCASDISRRYKDAIKRFHEEALPLYILIRAMYADRELRVWLPADDGPNDAHLQIDGRIECIQIANSIDGYDNSRRMKILCRDGSVPTHGPLHRVKENGRKYDVPGVRVMQPRDKTLDDTVSLLRQTINSKKKKSYPRGTWFVVWYDDPRFLSARDYGVIERAAAEAVQDSDFSRAFIVSRVDPPVCKVILDRTLT